MLIVIICIVITCEKIYNFYKSNIKDITFEYNESKFIDIEKNIEKINN